MVETPTLDRLAGEGLRYTNMNTTALCSPTRGCILTGRNHHTLGLSAITELSMGYPAHNGYMGFEHGLVSEMLLDRGYNTFCICKWHIATPEDGTLAGSCIGMIDAVKYVVSSGLADREEAIRMASAYPAAALGVDDRYGYVKAGYRANLLALDDDLNVVCSVIDGELERFD